ncbi:MAG: metallophosphoesterase family protein [Acidobacteriaceae bacterium]
MRRITTLCLLGLLSACALPLTGQTPSKPIDPVRPTFIVPDLKPDQPMRILVYGDMRFTNPFNTSDTSPRARQWLAAKVAEEHPDAVFMTGDVPFRGSNPADWAVFRREAQSWWTDKLRVYPTIGNHELIPHATTGLKNYYANFPQVGGHPFYSVLMGNVFLINLDSSQPMWPRGAQADWIRGQIDHTPPSADFVFIMLHIPLIADVQSEFIANIPSPEAVVLRRYLEARAAVAPQKFIVVNGHIHNYERFEMNGITHIITGGGGAAPYPVLLRGPDDKYRDTAFPVFNYVILTIEGKHADGKMYKIADPEAKEYQVEVKDTFSEDAH